LLLAAGVDNKTTDYVAGWVGLFTAGVALFLASAELINDILGGGREIIPLGAFEANRFKFAGHFHVPGRIHGSHFGPDHSVSPVPSSRSIDRHHVQISSSNDYLGADTINPNHEQLLSPSTHAACLARQPQTISRCTVFGTDMLPRLYIAMYCILIQLSVRTIHTIPYCLQSTPFIYSLH